MADFIYSFTSYPAPRLLRMLVNGISAKQTSNGDKQSPWNILSLIGIFPVLMCPSVCRATFQSSIFFIERTLLISMTVTMQM